MVGSATPHYSALEKYCQCRGVTGGIRADSSGVQVKEVDLTNRWNQELVQFYREPGEW